ncbi:ATP-binding protein [Pontiella agarivorans]|uniref:histidine kinase n=1 Tax=Pontiella agarivorans TaxID=3038953 RepID=A0ABU5N0U2_9BACT|nr:ATP-binding protein [Pontiella agarivorans]MDZ8120066.1 ATP-binding protein [Pontiella agarivorans]
MSEPFNPLQIGLLNLPNEEIEDGLISELDYQLNSPPRLSIEPGVTLFEENQQLNGIWILLDGQVELYRKVNGEKIIFHKQTAGRILGLIALARNSRAVFSCCAQTPLKLLRITNRQLDEALQNSDILRNLLISVLLQSMGRRHKRLIALQEEVLKLNKDIAAEHEQVVQTLDELQKAQAMLVESEKMATLGQLSAGVAHELNNPVAAIIRASDFVHNDLLALSNQIANGRSMQQILDRSFHSESVSTRQQRAERKKLTAEINDAELADRLVKIGIHSAAEYELLSNDISGSPTEQLEQLELYHQIGSALRNISSCAGRISGIVQSLRSYIHADHPENEYISVHKGIDDTLLLFSNRLRNVTVEKEYGTLPDIIANAGELNQVWTNIIGNALDAMGNKGRLMIRTRCDTDTVTIGIIDNGPGISPENIDKIFELRFTTRKGRVDFGLGLGLSITKNIITRHGGRIDVTSEPGHTEFSITLPVEGAAESVLLSSQENPS